MKQNDIRHLQKQIVNALSINKVTLELIKHKHETN